MAPLQGAEHATDTNPAFHTGLLSSSPSATPNRVPNLNFEIVDKIAAAIGLTFTAEKAERVSSPTVREGSSSEGDRRALADARATDTAFAPIDILDYIYAVLHSPTYREKYKEFLKIDFPRVPYPNDAGTFWRLVALGGELRQIHLLESPVVEQFITGYPVDGDNIVVKPRFLSEPGAVATGFRDDDAEKNPVITIPGSDKIGRVFINDAQYFSRVPETAWNFYIGGYQPAQKWLKDRKGRPLGYEDIRHYQKIIVALAGTGRLMKEIDKIDIV